MIRLLQQVELGRYQDNFVRCAGCMVRVYLLYLQVAYWGEAVGFLMCKTSNQSELAYPHQQQNTPTANNNDGAKTSRVFVLFTDYIASI